MQPKTKLVLTITCEEVPDKGWVTHATGGMFGASASGTTWQEAYANLFAVMAKYPEDVGRGDTVAEMLANEASAIAD